MTDEDLTKTLLEYGFEWDEVEFYIRNPRELERLFN